ncbi:MAG: hypothetical protein M1820_004521 [Bogoriella megaspora]|nr:MAG: hypothetical protein M1820_004521 [Bogoriella megaspora]
MFQTGPPSATSRNPPLGSARLQNGKMAGNNAASWGFGGGMGAAPSLSNPQARMNNTSLSGFSQALGGSQPRASLQTTEFPSLDGERRQAQPPPGAGPWGQFRGRDQAGPPQGLGGQGAGLQGPSGQPQHQLGQQGQQTNQGSSAGPFGAGSNDSYPFSGQSGPGLPGVPQPQLRSTDDFPPLGQNGAADIPQDRTSGLGSLSGQGGVNAGDRSGLDGQVDSLSTRASTRSPFESMRSNRASFPDGDQSGELQDHQTPFSERFPSRGLQDAQQPPIGPPQSQLSNPAQGFTGQGMDSSSAAPQGSRKRISEMTEQEKWGFSGLFARLDPSHPDFSPLAQGEDLTTLGIDLNSPEPLYPTFGGPFSNPTERPAVPEYHTPSAYFVHNVSSMQSRIPSFSDETLIAIFHHYPHDIRQEHAAAELYSRDWRWHKKLRQWMMKDGNYGPPTQLGPTVEKGWYIFFDVPNWRRERREYVLDFTDLDDRHPASSATRQQPAGQFR